MEDNKLPYNDFERKEQHSKRMIVLVVISVLLGVNGLLLWQFFEKKAHLEEVSTELTNTLSAKDSLETELNQLKAVLEKANRENQSLHGRLAERENEIKAKMEEIQRLLNSGDAVQLEKAKKELVRLKQLNQGYLAQLDTLKMENANLSALNSSLNNTLTSERSINENLSKENQKLSNKVAAGAVLKAFELKAIGVKYKSTGKESETFRAAATDGIKTCFTLLENYVAEKGTKDAFVRVLSPDNAVMTTNSETFLYNNQPTLYTVKETFEYDNESTPVCVQWNKGSVYIKGKYTIEVYIDGSMVGSTFIELK
ncbi:MAG: hypothetical protein ACK560_01860 [Bacteroidota bacterium]|jgi:acyl transferase domain-containing protein